MTQTLQPPAQPKAVELPAPGMYPDVPFEQYLKWSALSKTILEYGVVSMKHLKAAADGKMDPEESDCLHFGRSLHARLLEPKRYRAEWAVMPDFQPDEPGKYKNYRATNEYKAKEEAWRKTITAANILSTTEAEVIEQMASGVMDHDAVKLLRASGGCELSMTWIDRETGLAIKSRMDKFCPKVRGVSAVVDLKGVRSLDPDDLSRQIHQLGWHRQSAIYVDGVKELTGEEPDFVFVCIEKTYPHDVAVYRVDDESIEMGRQDYRTVLQRWVKAIETGKYPGMARDIQSIGVPEWKKKQFRATKMEAA
jgi:exodeoxyribonuclease VIII